MLWPIISLMNTLSGVFYSIYLTVNGWVWPFREAAGLFYSISSVFASLGWAFGDFGNWVSNITNQLLTFINWNTLWSWFSQFYTMITTAWTWVLGAWTNVTSIVSSWWAATSATVLGWINTAVQGLAELRVAWGNFWTQTLPNLVSFQWLATWWAGQLPGVQSLILSTLKTAFPFYDEMVQLWGEIKAFFADPEQWVYNKLDSFFERFW